MVEISEIEDGDSLEAWLNDQPSEFSIVIASRCALRVLPLFWRWSLSEHAREADLPAPQALRSNLILAVACETPTEAIKGAVSDSSSASISFLADGDALEAWMATTQAVSAFTFFDETEFGIASVFAARSAEASVGVSEGAWGNIRQDCSDLEAGASLLKKPLWRDENPFADLWTGLRSKILSAENWQPGDWWFWVEWYEQMLDPISNPPNWELLEQVALIKSEVWDAGPEAVSEAIARIEERFELREETRQWQERVAGLEAELAFLQKRSHNQPPELVEDAVKILPQVTALRSQLSDVSEELSKPEPDASVLRKCGEAIKAAALAIVTYCGSVANDVIRAGTKPFGVAGATFLADKAFNDGRLVDYATKLINFATGG